MVTSPPPVGPVTLSSTASGALGGGRVVVVVDVVVVDVVVVYVLVVEVDVDVEDVVVGEVEVEDVVDGDVVVVEPGSVVLVDGGVLDDAGAVVVGGHGVAA